MTSATFQLVTGNWWMRVLPCALLVGALGTCVGCHSAEQPSLADGESHVDGQHVDGQHVDGQGDVQPYADSQSPVAGDGSLAAAPRRDVTRPRRPGDGQAVDTLWDKAAAAADAAPEISKNPPSLVQFVSPQRLAAAGLRIVEGKHLKLVTDLPVAAAVDELPGVFDLAVPLWVAYFGKDMADWDDWQMTGYLMAEPERFRATDLLPRDLPAFKNGYTLGSDFWCYDQKTDYYRRHLLLHEGVHGFMFTAYGTEDPPWHAEGMAELLATHRWHDGQLQLPYYPKHKDEVPLLGRIRIVKDEVASRRALRLSQVLQYNSRDHLRNEPYGWCWAAAAFLDGHPRYRDRFRAACRDFTGRNFNQEFEAAFAGDARQLGEEWLVFITGIQHAHDLDRTAIEYAPGEPLPADGRRVNVAVDRGWQSTRVLLEAGKPYIVAARGRYQVARDDQNRIWWCEPGGITLRYYQSRPLGILLGAVRSDEQTDPAESAFLRPQVIGLKSSWTPQQSGTLYLRINDSAGELADNEGQLEVMIRPKAGA